MTHSFIHDTLYIMEGHVSKTFENSMIRTAWNEQEEEWYFSIVDVVGALTEQETPRSASTYWAVLKKRLNDEGANQLLTNCKQLKMKSADGKMRLTDVANTEQRGVKKGVEYAILTDEITKARSGMTTRTYKNHKGLKKENLRDNMTTTEIILNMLAETAAKNISQTELPKNFEENQSVARRGGLIAGNARKELEAEIGHSVISNQNATQINSIVTNLIEDVSQKSPENK